MGPDVDRPSQPRQRTAQTGRGPAQSGQTDHAVDLRAAESDEDRPTTGRSLSVRVGCEACGARETYRTAQDTRTFFAVHPYTCVPATPGSSPTG